MLQPIVSGDRPSIPSQHPTEVADETSPIVFRSFKSVRSMMAGDLIELALLRFLESEPVVQSFETLGDGSVDTYYWGGRILVAALPSRGTARTEAIALKRRHEAAGRRLMLVPENRLTTWPVRDTCRIVSESGRVLLTPTERVLVLEALDDAGGEAPLGDLACLLHSREDPVSAVLSLVAVGMVRVDLRSPITALTRVFLFDPLILFR